MSKEKYSQTQSCIPIEGFGFQSQSEIPSISSSGFYKARATVHDRFKQSNKTCLDDAKTEVTRYLDEARIDCMGDEYLDLLTWWKVNSSRFKIISQVARDIHSIPISTVPSESAFSTGGRNWIQFKPLDDMTEEIDGAKEIDEEFINIGKEMEAAFENLNNDSMCLKASDMLNIKLLQFKEISAKKEKKKKKTPTRPIRHNPNVDQVGSGFRINRTFRVGSVLTRPNYTPS
uniref:HAT C-terminal dimerisation domain-containing protein n=1 Tax=Cucumis melo TaxID=3656 RepID=A0A9I9EGH8_CUCME